MIDYLDERHIGLKHLEKVVETPISPPAALSLHFTLNDSDFYGRWLRIEG
jgi:hypothetical protein